MPWQEGSILDMCATTFEDQFAAAAFALIVSRQNGKGGVLELRVIAGVTLPQFGEKRIIWTAHTAKTARDAHKRVADIFLSHPDLKARLKYGDERGITYGNDIRTITLKDGSEIFFFTRSATAGRGLFGDLLILDEALELTDTELSVLRYTLRTAARRTGRRAQTIYVSTPPDEEKHKHSLVLARLRKRALAGARGVGWVEFSVPTLKELQEAAEEQGRKLLGDPRLTEETYWPLGNPSLGYLFDLGQLQNDLVESGEREFLVEGLAAGDYWPDPDPKGHGDPAIDFEVWKDRRDPASVFGAAVTVGPVALGLEVSPRDIATLCAVGWRADGKMHGELVWSGPATAAVARLLQVVDKVDPATLVIDGKGKASSLIPDIRAKGLEPQVLTPGDRSRADEGLVRDIVSGQLRFPAQPMPDVDAAAEQATWRSTGDLRFFDRGASGAPPAPLVSLSLARIGLLTVAASPPEPPPAKALPLDDVHTPAGTGGFGGVLEQVDAGSAQW
ncbi:hypothetical protein [Blastococcus sp. CT_GayMR16]|uniref:hypothetical protein n=1 Tax=Blastococcus sp. CT_GayMR16 TaxID=2559607 RepID=UPI001073A3FC|nr:hypothetical protein [Blastococcus sp. CT_GayMR16]TFV83149.1 hypothetical protein E4P38_21065 [Blastococcus sp. CT_GayMR16]